MPRPCSRALADGSGARQPLLAASLHNPTTAHASPRFFAEYHGWLPHRPVSFAILDVLAMSIIQEAACTVEVARKAYSLLFRLSLSLASFRFDGRLPWVDDRFP
jgi:hypothetical protein